MASALTLDAMAAQTNAEGLTLLNVSHCPHVSTVPALRHFAAMLGRLDDPSHWLVWTKRRVCCVWNIRRNILPASGCRSGHNALRALFCCLAWSLLRLVYPANDP